MPGEPIDLDRLGDHLSRAGLATGPLTAELVGGGKSNLTFRITDGDHRWVLRRPPLGDRPAGAHDVEREYRVMAALAGSGIPVPEVAWMERDETVLGAPFYLMVEVPGTVLRTPELVAELTSQQRQRLSENLVDTLAALHQVDPAEVGLQELGRPEGFLERQLSRWARQYERIRVRDLPLVAKAAEALRRDLPRHSAAAIVHGDYRIDNVIVDPQDPGRIAAVLDWEMATLGDPLADLGILVMFWDEPDRLFNPITRGLTAADGFFTIDEVVERYLGRRGLENVDLRWYLAFSRFKLAVILEQIHARHLSGRTVGDGFDGIDVMVEQLLDELAVALHL